MDHLSDTPREDYRDRQRARRPDAYASAHDPKMDQRESYGGMMVAQSALDVPLQCIADGSVTLHPAIDIAALGRAAQAARG